MSNLKSALILLLSFISGLSAFNVNGQDQPKEADVKLFTPYMRVSVMPGESVDYQLTFINNLFFPETLYLLKCLTFCFRNQP